MNLKKYINELKRRHVFKAGVAYLIVAWLIAQIASIVLPTFDAPDYIMKTLIFILIIGFPINLIFSWIYDVTPEGIKKTENILVNSPKSIIKNKRLNKVIIISLSITVVFLLYNQFWGIPSNDLNLSDSTTNEKSIAVLPLFNITQKDELEYFSDGVTQEIIDELAKIKTFNVTAFSSSIPYKNKDKSPLEIANELDVNYLISGSARVYGDSVKLSIELINPHSKERVWSQTYNEVMNNAPSIQLLIAKQVAKSLNIKLTPTEKISLDKLNTTDGEAFNLFLKAKSENLKLTPEGFNNARQYLERAIELDPYYSQAYTLLAFNHNLDGQGFFNAKIGTSETLSLVSPLINKSMSLDPESSDIYLVRANLNLFAKGQLRDAKKDVEYALELNSWPRVPTNYCICTVVSTYVALGDLLKAKELANLGREVDPGNVFIYWDQANIHMLEGQVKKAQALYEEGLNNLDIPFFQFFLGWSYYHDQQFTEAIKHFEKAYENDQVPLHMNVAYLSNSHFMLGNKIESEQYLQVLKKRMESGDHHVNLAMAMISAAQSDVDETLSWLEKSQEKSENTFAYMVNVDPIFKPILDNPRFVEMRRKMQYYE